MKYKVYRRRKNSDTWHFMPECFWWLVSPRNRYVEQTKKPTTGELCDQCKAKARAKR